MKFLIEASIFHPYSNETVKISQERQNLDSWNSFKEYSEEYWLNIARLGKNQISELQKNDIEMLVKQTDEKLSVLFLSDKMPYHKEVFLIEITEIKN
jgi:hypothetical protein